MSTQQESHGGSMLAEVLKAAFVVVMVWVLWPLRALVAWMVVVTVVWTWAPSADWWLVASAALGLLVLLVLTVAAQFWWLPAGWRRWAGWTRHLSPAAFTIAYQDKRRARRARGAAELLGIHDSEDERRSVVQALRPDGDGVAEVWRVPSAAMPGVTDEALAVKARSLLQTLGYVDVSVQYIGGAFLISWWTIQRPDPLRTAHVIDAPPTDWDHTRVPYGVAEDGSPVYLGFENVSGVVVAGLPGGGKTAGLLSVMSTLATSDSVQFAIWDGKGGHDWDALAPRVQLFNTDDEDLVRVADELDAYVGELRRRARDLPAAGGPSNLWARGVSAEVPHLVLLIDECQTYLDPKQWPKDKADTIGRIQAGVSTLIRKGRSAAITVILTTQKPTADSIPTSSRDNAAARIAFRLLSNAAEVAVLGDRGEPSPLNLPTVPGVAVVMAEDGSRQRVRFSYMPEEVVAGVAREYAHLTRPLPGIREGASQDA